MSFKHMKSARKLNEEREFNHEEIEIHGLALKRGGLIEFCGAMSSGKVSVLMNLLSELTNRGEICAVVDVDNSFDPPSAKEFDIKLNNILWAKCGGDLEAAVTVTDYLVQARSCGVIWLNLKHTDRKSINAIPISYWYRFRTKLKDSPTLLIVTAVSETVGSAKTQGFYFENTKTTFTGIDRFKLLKEFQVSCEPRKTADATRTWTRLYKEY